MALQKRPYSILDRSSRDGYIEFNGGSSMLRCQIRFSSESGANLEFESVKDIPLGSCSMSAGTVLPRNAL
jgi:hypothetical protein